MAIPSPTTVVLREDHPAIPLMDFERQLGRANQVLHFWLEDCEAAEFLSAKDKFDSITKLVRGLHDNIKLVSELIRLMHDLYDQYTFQRIVLEALGEIAPELRLKVVQRIQQARAGLGSLPDLARSVGK